MYNTKIIFISFTFLVNLFFQVNAATIAIIDSGTDITHSWIAPHAWTNVNEISDNQRDEDKNGYPDDVNGWNFAETNNEIIDYQFVGLFNEDIRTFFQIQTKVMLNTVTADEIKWIKEKVKDQDFIKNLTIFANFMHGTHVAGIAVNNTQETLVLPIKILPTDVGNIVNPNQSKNFLVKGFLKLLAGQQVGMLEEVSAYVDFHKADVANGSFGTGFAQAQGIITMLYKKILKKDIEQKKLKELSLYFLNALIKKGKILVETAPNTLFVYASGNDGTNNDELPTFPSNVQADNIISVAATHDRVGLALFSNYGIKSVDIAAPGVAIMSSIPGEEFLAVSGTSQAAPYVAKIASLVKDINNQLTPKEVKTILMQTTDVKDFLKDKVKCSGIINKKRALRAGELSLTNSLTEAIVLAKQEIGDIESKSSKSSNVGIKNKKSFILPLPSLIRW